MKLSLSTGVPDSKSYKKTFLQYSGISSAVVPGISKGIENGIRVFIWDKMDDIFLSYCDEKIVVITQNSILKRILNQDSKKKKGYYFKADGGSFSGRSFLMNIECEPLSGNNTYGCCYDNTNKAINNSGIVIKEYNNMLFIALPWDILDVDLGYYWYYQIFYSQFVKKHFIEVGPNVDYGALRRLLIEIVAYSFKYLGLPFVKIAYPFYDKPCFSFRIDADGFSKESTDSVLRIAKAVGNAVFTWFIDVDGWGKDLSYINHLREANQDIQIHCYYHMTYKDIRLNKYNINKGTKILNRLSIYPKATVSPLGYWFDGFQEALRSLGLNYSSEFAFNVDDMPSFPYNNADYPIQVPVHCGSIGVFEKDGFSKDDIFNHLKFVLEKSIKDFGCGIIYDHPLHRIEKYEKEFIDLFNNLKEKGYYHVSLSEYAEANKKFLLHKFCPYIEDKMLKIDAIDKSYDPKYDILSQDDTIKIDDNIKHSKKNALPDIKDEYIFPPEDKFNSINSAYEYYKPITEHSVVRWYAGCILRKYVKPTIGYIRGILKCVFMALDCM